MQGRWQALRLSRRQKAVALCVASLCVWAGSGWTTRLQVLLLGALTVRCNLKPAEVCCVRLPIMLSWAPPHIGRCLEAACSNSLLAHCPLKQLIPGNKM